MPGARAAVDAPRGRRPLRRARAMLGWAAIVAFAWVLWPAAWGGSTTMIVVSGDSMIPTYESGDVVIARAGTPEIGDAVVYATRDTGGGMIVHRIIAGDALGGFELKGDNNDFIDPFHPVGTQIVGIARARIPSLGTVLAHVGDPSVWGSLLAGSGALLLWPRRAHRRGAHDARADHDSGAGDDWGAGALGTDDAPSADDASASDGAAADGRARRRSLRAVHAVGAALALALVAVADAGPASAARLDVDAHGSLVRTESACTSGPLAVIPASNHTVTVVDVPEACEGLDAELWLVSDTDALVASGGARLQAGDHDVHTSDHAPSDVARAVLLIGSWWVDVVWTAPEPPEMPDVAASCVPVDASGIEVDGTCETTNVRFGRPWGDPGRRIVDAYVTVSSTSGFSRITLNLAVAPWPEWPDGTITQVGNLVWGAASNCSTPGVYVLDSPAWQGRYYLQIGESRAAPGSVCAP